MTIEFVVSYEVSRTVLYSLGIAALFALAAYFFFISYKMEFEKIIFSSGVIIAGLAILALLNVIGIIQIVVVK